MQTRILPFMVALKAALLLGLLVIVPLYAALVGAETGHPVRGALKGFILLSAVAVAGCALWWLVRRIKFRRGGPGLEPPPPQVREPRPPGGRPPALSAAARPDDDQRE